MKELILAILLGMGGGGVYAMLGVGIVTAYKGSGVINFAHGAFAMYAAFTFDELTSTGRLALPWVDFLPTHKLNIPVLITVKDGGIGSFPAAVIALVMAAFIGLLGHLLVFRPLRNAPALGKVIGSVGLMLYLQAVALLNFGNAVRAPEGFVPKEPINNFLGLGGAMPRLNLYLAVIAVLMGAAVWALLTFSRFGLATRAADENEKGASLLGYNPQRLAAVNWVLSAVLAGLVGVLFVGGGPLDTVQFTLLIVPALGAALLGRLTSVPIATAGGLLIGMFQAGMVNISERSWWPDALPAAGVRELIPFLVIAGFLFLRGDQLPIRGTVLTRRQARAPEPTHILIGTAIPVIVALFLVNVFTGNWEVALTTTLISGMIMLSWVVITGYLGQISLVQLSLAGVAAYTAARLSANVEKVSQFDLLSVHGPNLPDPIAALLGVAAAVALGMLIGIPAIRIRGVQLAVVTLAAVAPISLLILRNEKLYGASAVSNYPIPKPNWFGAYVGAADPDTAQTDYWGFSVFAIVVFALLALAIVGLRKGVTGRQFLAVRANERAAAAAGINVAATKLLGFAIAAGIAGVAGVMQSYRLGVIRIDTYSLFVGLALFAFVYIGGITRVYGAIVGGFLIGGGIMAVFISTQASQDFEAYVPLIGAIGLILNAVLNPEGVAASLAETGKGLWGKLARRPARAPAVPAEPAGAIPAGSR